MVSIKFLLLTLFKIWNSSKPCIHDPFTLSHSVTMNHKKL